MSVVPMHLVSAYCDDESNCTRFLGRQPTTESQREKKMFFSAVPGAAQLSDAPDSCDWSGAPYTAQILLNNQLGCCGPAAMMEAQKVWAARHGVSLTVSDADVISLYSAAGGYVPGRPWTDGGVNNPTMLSVCHSKGIMINGTKHLVGPTATINSSDVMGIRNGVWYLGGALFGIELSQTCYNKYGPGNVWDVDGSRIVGGHDVWCLAYNATGPIIVTWAAVTQCTWAWAAKYADDIDVMASSQDWAAGGVLPCGIDLTAWKEAEQVITGQAA